MAVIRVSPKQLGKALHKKHQRIFRALAQGALAGANRGRALIVRKTPVDQGQLKNTWKVIPGNQALLRGTATPRMFAASVLAELRNTAPHGGIVELGARPHKTSPEGWMAIYDWVVRHRQSFGLVTKAGKARRVRKGKVAVHGLLAAAGVGLDPEIAGITWGIVKKLERQGQKPTYFVKGSLDELLAVVQREVDRALTAESGPSGDDAGPMSWEGL
jgi:hypothetical protein